jgi:transposase
LESIRFLFLISGRWLLYRIGVSFFTANSLHYLLCLFIYSMVEYSMVEFRLRRALERTRETVIGQTKKQTQRPTLKWVFFQFRRLREYSVVVEGKRIPKISNLTADLMKILGLLGPPYEKYYF